MKLAKPLILTMWSDFINHDGDRITKELKSMSVIVVKRLSLTLFHGMSLSTKPNSSFHINPSLKEAISLRSWALKNSQFLSELAKTKAHQYVLRDLVNPYDQQYVHINNVPSDIDQVCYSRCLGHTSMKEQAFWYFAEHFDKLDAVLL